jgi:DNA-binding transcriptional ArsR family regulator
MIEIRGETVKMYEVAIGEEVMASGGRAKRPGQGGGKKKESKTCLTYSYMGMYCFVMARASTTSDAFNAVAEPRRREILSYLGGTERPVGEIVAALGMEQPSISKHLRVLRAVGLVRMRCQGRQKLYRTNAEAIRPLHEWAGTFERYWQHQLNRVKERAEAIVRQGSDVNPQELKEKK